MAVMVNRVVNMVILNRVVMVALVNRVAMVDRTGQDRTGQNRHVNLTFQVTCDWQLSQFLRCFLFLVSQQSKSKANKLLREVFTSFSSVFFSCSFLCFCISVLLTLASSLALWLPDFSTSKSKDQDKSGVQKLASNLQICFFFNPLRHSQILFSSYSYLRPCTAKVKYKPTS